MPISTCLTSGMQQEKGAFLRGAFSIELGGHHCLMILAEI